MIIMQTITRTQTAVPTIHDKKTVLILKMCCEIKKKGKPRRRRTRTRTRRRRTTRRRLEEEEEEEEKDNTNNMNKHSSYTSENELFYCSFRYFFNRRKLQTMLPTFNSVGKVTYRLINFFFPTFSNDTIIPVILTSCLNFSFVKSVTFSLPVVSFLLLLYGYITAKYRSNAMTTREKEEAVAPVHIRFPPVKNLHSSVPAKPSGCLNA